MPINLLQKIEDYKPTIICLKLTLIIKHYWQPPKTHFLYFLIVKNKTNPLQNKIS